jgi:serine/threonine protein phosphatase PrpC
MKLRHSARTDVGRTRDHNEDNYAVGEGEQTERLGVLLVVCDGMGGHASGEVASHMAVETILADYYADGADERPAALEQAFDHANEQIYTSGRGSMGTTGVAALLHHDALHIANVGDSRAYLIREGEIRQVSRDHSFVSDQVAAGLITPEQARSSPHRNVITRALGYQPEVSVDMFRLPLQVGDIILLCSDGLHGLVTDEEIVEIVSANDLDEATSRLIDLANQRGGSDNITVALTRVEALDWDAQPVTEQDLAADQPRAAVELPIREDAAALTPVPEGDTSLPQAPTRPTQLVERRLTLLGGLLATLLLSVLLFGIWFALNQPVSGSSAPPTVLPLSSPAPSPPSTPTASPASTSAATAPAATATTRPTP